MKAGYIATLIISLLAKWICKGMFWYLLFAHFAADYPLQPNWMAKNKTRMDILVLHVGIHFLLYILVVLSISWALLLSTWSYLLLLTFLHFVIDMVKNQVNRRKPEWVGGPYLIDQAAHYLTIFLVVWLVESQVEQSLIAIESTWVVYAAAYLIVTYVWYISERILVKENEQYRREIIAHFWPRMAARSLLLSIMMLLWRNFGGTGVQAGIILQFFAAALMAQISRERTNWLNLRAVITDVSAAALGLMYIVIGTG
ncbi:MAG: DUF3307 domain-containing protein [Chloroflexi bacterium]|nr:MAG: DUF3307 domain-containing protein [Chloroflexota bacterium]